MRAVQAGGPLTARQRLGRLRPLRQLLLRPLLCRQVFLLLLCRHGAVQGGCLLGRCFSALGAHAAHA